MYFDPSETLWEDASGQLFELSELLGMDNLYPFDGIAGFNWKTTDCYAKTLFRFPLRTKPSHHFGECCTPESILKLVHDLKSEARYLLIFLRNVVCIEFYNIDQNTGHNLIFKVEIALHSRHNLDIKRFEFLHAIKDYFDGAHANIASTYQYTTTFDVNVSDKSGPTPSHWITSNKVDFSVSTSKNLRLGKKCIPWVGTALELENPGTGRLFCFLPMPTETGCKLPVHINGTFGLNDDRNSMKWPTLENQNDPIANWNAALVNEHIPSCLNTLLLFAKSLMKSSHFYAAWPTVSSLEKCLWSGLLKPFYEDFFREEVVWSESSKKWVLPKLACYLPQDNELDPGVYYTLKDIGLNLASVPDHILEAITKYMNCDEIVQVTPRFTRDTLRNNVICCSHERKLSLLIYCLSDNSHDDLNDLELLPLADGSFTSFKDKKTAKVYVCTQECPQHLLPNLHHKLVDLTENESLQNHFVKIARREITQLVMLSEDDLVELITENMPREWKNRNIVFSSFLQFCEEWLKKFWEWVRNKDLQKFSNLLVLPVQNPMQLKENVSLVRLTHVRNVLYIPRDQVLRNEMKSLLSKYGVLVTYQEEFPYISHPKLHRYCFSHNSDNILSVICNSQYYDTVQLNQQEAKHLRCNISNIRDERLDKLYKIKMFVTTHGKIISISDLGCTKAPKIIEPPNLYNLMQILPIDITIPSNDSSQMALLTKLHVKKITDAEFVERYVIQWIKTGTISEILIDQVMESVLDVIDTLKYQSKSICESLKYLKFVKNGLRNRRCPHELFNCRKKITLTMYKGERDMFPYKSNIDYIKALSKCGLKDYPTPQQVLDVIYAISVPHSATPQCVSSTKITRAKAILEYIESDTFHHLQTLRGRFIVLKNEMFYYFHDALICLCKRQCWIPVQHTAPSKYLKGLLWKGSSYSSHFISLSNVSCLSCSSEQTAMLLYGSEVFFSIPMIKGKIFENEDFQEPTEKLLPHFKQLICHHKESAFCATKLENMVDCIYSTMSTLVNKGKFNSFMALSNLTWILIPKENKFVTVAEIAEQPHPKFHHRLEPYVYLLPDSFSKYSPLFKHLGMNTKISGDQIISVLMKIKDQVSAKYIHENCEAVWEMILTILIWLTDNGEKDIDLEYKDKVLVPAEVHSAFDSTDWPDLAKISELVYVDNEVLKTIDVDVEQRLVHKCITNNLAKHLQIAPLSQILGISSNIVDNAEQCSDIKLDIQDILDQYKEDLMFVKEMIQNADDAGATEINFCYDGRRHDCKPDDLFIPGMAKCSGPALLVQNDQTFSEEDFESIQKLAAATKKGNHGKIGKFGKGFCTVYEVTDIPSFVSKDRFISLILAKRIWKQLEKC